MTLFMTFLIAFGILSLISSALVVAAGILSSRQKQQEAWTESYEQPVNDLPEAQTHAVE